MPKTWIQWVGNNLKIKRCVTHAMNFSFVHTRIGHKFLLHSGWCKKYVRNDRCYQSSTYVHWWRQDQYIGLRHSVGRACEEPWWRRWSTVPFQHWLDHQKSAAGWLMARFFLLWFKDRIINTLACIVALKSWNIHPDKCQKGRFLYYSRSQNLTINMTVRHSIQAGMPGLSHATAGTSAVAPTKVNPNGRFS